MTSPLKTGSFTSIPPQSPDKTGDSPRTSPNKGGNLQMKDVSIKVTEAAGQTNLTVEAVEGQPKKLTGRASIGELTFGGLFSGAFEVVSNAFTYAKTEGAKVLLNYVIDEKDLQNFRKVINDSKRMIKANIQGENGQRFLEIETFISDFFIKFIKDNQADWLEGSVLPLDVVVENQDKLNLFIEANIAQVFVNLSEAIKQAQARGEYAGQSPLVILISLLSQQAALPITSEKLESINNSQIINESQLELQKALNDHFNSNGEVSEEISGRLKELDLYLSDRAKRMAVIRNLFVSFPEKIELKIERIKNLEQKIDVNLASLHLRAAQKIEERRVKSQKKLAEELLKQPDPIKQDVLKAYAEKNHQEDLSALQELAKRLYQPQKRKRALERLFDKTELKDLASLLQTIQDDETCKELGLKGSKELQSLGLADLLAVSFDTFSNETEQSIKKINADVHSLENRIERDLLVTRLFSMKSLDAVPVAIKEATQKLDELENVRDQALFNLFAETSTNLLTLAFPGGIDSLIKPRSNLLKFILDHFHPYELIKNKISQLIVAAYQDIRPNARRDEAWAATIKRKVGGREVQSLTYAPAILLKQILSAYIHTSPQVLGMVENELAAVIGELDDHPIDFARSQHVKDAENHKKEALVAKMSQQNLAGWLLGSLKELLDSENTSLSQAGSIVNGLLQTITLGLLGKGFSLGEGNEQSLTESRFLSDVMDHLMAKINSLQKGEPITEQFGEDFIKDLPIPGLIRGAIASLITAKAREMQLHLITANQTFDETNELYDISMKKIQAYQGRGRDELIRISQSMTEKIVSSLLKQNLGLLNTLGLNETIEESISDYLPGVVIDPALTQWLKNNISKLDANKTTIESFKKAVQALFLHSLVTTLEANSEDDRDFSAQLLNKLHQAFLKAFPGFTDEKKGKLSDLLKIQTELKQLEKTRYELKTGLSKLQSSVLNPAQQEAMTSLAQFHKRSLKIKTNIKELQKKSERLISLIPDFKEKLSDFPEMFKFQKKQQAKIEQQKQAGQSHVGALCFIKQEIQAKLESNPTQTKFAKFSREIELIDKLIDIHSEQVTSKQLEIIEELLQVNQVLQQQQQAQHSIQQSIQRKKHDIETQQKDSNENGTWEDVQTWIDAFLDSKSKINEIDYDMTILQERLYEQLGSFQELSRELFAIIGLDQPDKLKLPPLVKQYLWPFIESAKEKQVAALLLEQLAPTIIPIIDRETNKKTLFEKIGSPLLANICEAISIDAVGEISSFITNFDSLAEKMIKSVKGQDSQPNQEDVKQLSAKLTSHMSSLDARRSLKNETLADIYEEVFNSQWLNNQKEIIIQRFKDTKPFDLAVQVQSVLITPEEIAKYLNEFIPGAQDLHTIVAPELQAIISGKDHAFEANREVARQFIEGFLLQIFIKITDKNADDKKPILEVITEKLQNFEGQSKPASLGYELLKELTGETPTRQQERNFEVRFKKFAASPIVDYSPLINELEVVLERTATDKEKKSWPEQLKLLGTTFSVIESKLKAYRLSEDILDQVIGIKSFHDLEMLPPAFRQVAYEKIRDQRKMHFSPVLIPIIERKQNKEKLMELQGLPKQTQSSFLTDLCKAFAVDLTAKCPDLIDNYYPYAKEIFLELGGNEPTPDQLAKLSELMIDKIKNSKGKWITNKELVQAYEAASGRSYSSTERKDAINQLKQVKMEGKTIKSKIMTIKLSPQEMTKKISSILPHVDKSLQESLSNELQAFFHLPGVAYQHLVHSPSIDQPSLIEQYIEGSLLKVLIKVAEANQPPTGSSKDVLTLLTEKSIKIVEEQHHLLSQKASLDIKDEAKALNERLMKEAFGIDSPEVFEGMPPALQNMAYDLIKNQLGEGLTQLVTGLKRLENNSEGVVKASANVRSLFETGVDQPSPLLVIASDIGQLVSDAIPYTLSQMAGEKVVGAAQISGAVKSMAEEFKEAHFTVAEVLLKYTHGSDLNKLLADNLVKAGDPETLKAEKAKVAEIVGNVLLQPIANALSGLMEQENNRKEELNQNLITNILQAVCQHFRIVNEAKDNGGKAFNYQHFIKAAGKDRMPKVDYRQLARTFTKTLNQLLEMPLQKRELKGIAEALIEHISLDASGFTLDQAKLFDIIETYGNITLEQTEKDRLSGKDSEGQSFIDFIKKNSQPVAERYLHGATPKAKANYQPFIDEINRKLPNLLSPARTQQLAIDLQKLAEKDSPLDEPLTNELIFNAIESHIVNAPKQKGQLVVFGQESRVSAEGYHLTLDQKEKLIAPDASGLSLIERIRKETKAADTQKRENFHDPLIKQLLTILFPNGRDDLTFLPEIVRDQTWKLLKTQLFPLMLPILMETLLDPNTILTMALSSLEKMKETMKGPVVLGASIPEDETYGELDRVSGELVVELLKGLTLPAWASDMLKAKDENGRYVYGATLGATLRGTFNDQFLKQTLQQAFVNFAAKDPQIGESKLKFDTRLESIKLTDKKQKRVHMQAELKKKAREVVDSSLSFGIRTQWAKAQKKWDDSIALHLPKGSAKIKRALDKAFSFVFFKIVGTVLDILFRPMIWAIKQGIYRYMKIDRNIDRLMDPFIRVPIDQPGLKSSYAVYNENLVYNLVDAIRKSLETASWDPDEQEEAPVVDQPPPVNI